MISSSEKQTIEIAEKFAKSLRGGEVCLLIGDLGAGKTVFVKGVAIGLKYKNRITSPTFTLMKAYECEKCKIKTLVHIDTYRGADLTDLQEIGALEYFGRTATVCFVEWGEGLEKYLKKNSIKFKKIIIKNLDFNKREIKY